MRACWHPLLPSSSTLGTGLPVFLGTCTGPYPAGPGQYPVDHPWKGSALLAEPDTQDFLGLLRVPEESVGAADLLGSVEQFLPIVVLSRGVV